MTAADRCRCVAEACCQLIAPDESWRVVINASDQNVLVEIFAAGDTFSRLVGKHWNHANAMHVLMTSAARHGGERVRVMFFVYHEEKEMQS